MINNCSKSSNARQNKIGILLVMEKDPGGFGIFLWAVDAVTPRKDFIGRPWCGDNRDVYVRISRARDL